MYQQDALLIPQQNKAREQPMLITTSKKPENRAKAAAAKRQASAMDHPYPHPTDGSETPFAQRSPLLAHDP